MMMLKFSSI